MIKNRKHTRLQSILRNGGSGWVSRYISFAEQTTRFAKRRRLYCLKASMAMRFFLSFSLTWTVKPCCMDINKTKKMQQLLDNARCRAGQMMFKRRYEIALVRNSWIWPLWMPFRNTFRLLNKQEVIGERRELFESFNGNELLSLMRWPQEYQRMFLGETHWRQEHF